MRFRFLLLITFASGLFGCNLIAKEKTASFEGEWFSNVTRQPKGFNARELYFFRTLKAGKFVFSQISFNETRKWEEIRYSGKWVLENGKADSADLKPEDCSIYAAPELGKRWILIRTFDCDHLSFRAKIQSDKAISLSPSMDFGSPEIFQRVENDPDLIQAMVILTDTKNFTSWGLRLNRARKSSKQHVMKRFGGAKIPVLIQEAIDSSATHKAEGNVEIGDILVIQNEKAKGFLE